jgi:hypothetical protein
MEVSVSSLPERPNLDHLRKQAKTLLRDFSVGDAGALARIGRNLPAANGKTDAELRAMALQLRDAQSCIAREYGFPSWTELKQYVDWTRVSAGGRPMPFAWLRLIYTGDVSGGNGRARPGLALRLLAEHPRLADGDPSVACALGDEPRIHHAIAADPA